MHAGDIIEGNSQADKYSLDVNEQVIYLKKLYSTLKGIKTYLLFGEREYEALNFDGINESEFRKMKNLEIIGLNHSYVSMDERLIKVTHECTLSNFLLMPELESEFELFGHKHFFTFNPEYRQITLSSLTNINEWNGMSFLELNNEEKEYVFKRIDTKERLINEFKLNKKNIV